VDFVSLVWHKGLLLCMLRLLTAGGLQSSLTPGCCEMNVLFFCTFPSCERDFHTFLCNRRERDGRVLMGAP